MARPHGYMYMSARVYCKYYVNSFIQIHCQFQHVLDNELLHMALNEEYVCTYMHVNILTLSTDKMSPAPSHLHTNSWSTPHPRTAQPEYLGSGGERPVLRGTWEKSFPVQYMYQGTVR